MKHRKQGVGLLGLLAVIALGVAAFASSAQALTPEFVVGGALVKAGLDATLAGKQIGRGTLLVKALGVEFNCEKFTVNKGLLAGGVTTDAEGELTYEECTVLETAAALGEIPCTVGAAGNGKIIANALILPAELNVSSFAVLAEKIKALITLSGANCVLPLDNTVTGELCLKILNNESVNLILDASEAIQAECRPREALEGTEGAGTIKDVLKYGTQVSIVDGSAEVFLSGKPLEHEGKTLGVLLF